MTKILEAHKEFATETQCKYIDAVLEHGSYRAAARALGVNKNTIGSAMDAVIHKASVRGFSPEHDYKRPVPEPFVVRGVSSYYNKDGDLAGQWVKSKLDDQKFTEHVKAAIEELSREIPRAKPAEQPSHTHDKLCNLYTFTDCHVGLLSWPKETGDDWNLEIAEQVLTSAFRHMVASSPKAHTAIINQLGDYLHFDGLDAVTPTSRNLLDVDGRFSNVVRVAVRILRAIIDEALVHHDIVQVIMAEGNHDMSSSVWLRHLFALLYENEPRVIVNESELPYYAIQHGVCMLGFHHGHLSKKENLPAIFAAEYRAMWGETTKAYIHTGHMHHIDEKEYNGAKVIQHATMAARDSYAARHGYLSDRQITAITYHSAYGEVARNTVYPEMLS